MALVINDEPAIRTQKQLYFVFRKNILIVFFVTMTHSMSHSHQYLYSVFRFHDYATTHNEQTNKHAHTQTHTHLASYIRRSLRAHKHANKVQTKKEEH